MLGSEVQIINLALGRIGNAPIVGLTDPTKAAKVAAETFPIRRDALLRKHRWNFAKTRVVLAPLADLPPFGGARYYAKPGDLLAVIGAWEHGWGDDRNTTGSREALTVEGTRLVWPFRNLNLFYTRRVENVGEMDALFVDVLAWELAADLAMALANDAEKSQLAAGMAGRALLDARRANALETAPEMLVASEWLDGRWSYGGPRIGPVA